LYKAQDHWLFCRGAIVRRVCESRRSVGRHGC
jgi:hypothetical protein